MLNIDQVIEGDCIKLLNGSPEGWVDLVFADPPFNIGYLYHNYNDTRNTEDYLKFSEDWMRAVHRTEKELAGTGAALVHVMDREADDYDILCELRSHSYQFVIEPSGRK